MTIPEATEFIESLLEDFKQQHTNIQTAIEDAIATHAAVSADLRNIQNEFEAKKIELTAELADLEAVIEAEGTKLDELKHGVMDLASKKASLLVDHGRLAKEIEDFRTYEMKARRLLDNQEKVIQAREVDVRARELLMNNKQSFLNPDN